MTRNSLSTPRMATFWMLMLVGGTGMNADAGRLFAAIFCIGLTGYVGFLIRSYWDR